MQKSNILYLTNQCNLACEYCYQLADREVSKPYEISQKEIEDFIAEIIEREGLETTSTVVLFGGEPLLNKYKFFEVLSALEESTRKTGKKFAISVTTNGLAFLDTAFYEAYCERISKLQNTFSLEISYDGVGQFRRVSKTGKSYDIQKILNLFKPQEISIRYTIHAGNYKCCIYDLIKLQGYKKIIVNFYESELDSLCDISQFKEKLQRVTEYLFTRYHTPVCYLNCRLCGGCNFASYNGINYNGKFVVDGNAGEFNHFSERIGK